MFERKDRLYHSTPKKNVASILEKGLIASPSGIVYLSERPESWNSDGCVVLEIDIQGFNARMTTFGEENLDEILCWGNVPKERIKVYKGE